MLQFNNERVSLFINVDKTETKISSRFSLIEISKFPRSSHEAEPTVAGLRAWSTAACAIRHPLYLMVGNAIFISSGVKWWGRWEKSILSTGTSRLGGRLSAT